MIILTRHLKISVCVLVKVTSLPLSIQFPVPDPNDLQVRQLTVGRFVKASNGTLTVNVSWKKPAFKYSVITNYAVTFSNSYSKVMEKKTVS